MAKRQGFFNKLIMGSDSLPDFTAKNLPTTRWGLFWDVFKNRFFELFKVSLLGDLFAIPLILVLFFAFLSERAYNIYIPYDGNIGIGYPLEPNAAIMGQVLTYYSAIRKFAMLIPCIMIFAIGLSGVFYVMRRLVWGEDVSVVRHFFKGVKENWLASLITGSVFALSLFMMMYNFLNNELNDNVGFFNILLTVIGVLQFVVVCCWALFMLSQEVTFKLKMRELVMNSFLFAIALVLNSVLFIMLAVLPIAFTEILSAFVPVATYTVSPAVYIAYLALGLGYSSLVLTVYSHFVFDKYLMGRIEGAKKNRGMYVKTEEEKKAEEIARIKNHNVIYGEAYVARRLGTIDDGSDITPLSSSYSRSDLQRLSEEKEKIKEEEAERRKIANEEIRREIEEYDARAAESNKKKKGKKK